MDPKLTSKNISAAAARKLCGFDLNLPAKMPLKRSNSDDFEPICKSPKPTPIEQIDKSNSLSRFGFVEYSDIACLNTTFGSKSAYCVLLRANEAIGILGDCKMLPLIGNVHILGAKINAKYKTFQQLPSIDILNNLSSEISKITDENWLTISSRPTNPMITISSKSVCSELVDKSTPTVWNKITEQSIKNFSSAILLTPVDDSFAQLDELYPKISSEFIIQHIQNDGKAFEALPLDWANVMDQIIDLYNQSSEALNVLVIGQKNTGKSTFLRFLGNKLRFGRFPSDKAKKILYMDLDPGQTVLGPPRTIGLYQLESTAFGTSLVIPCEKSCYLEPLGESSPKNCPERYMNSLNRLLDFVNTNRSGFDTPINLINTMGWVKDFGQNVLNHLLKNLQGKYVVIGLNCSTSKVLDTNSCAKVFELTSVSQNFKERLTTSELSTIRMSYYLHSKNGKINPLPLNYHQQFNIDFKNVIAALPIILKAQEIAMLNCSIVALWNCTSIFSERIKCIKSDSNLLICANTEFENILVSFKENVRIVEHCVCLGLALITHIDDQMNQFYLSTPINSSLVDRDKVILQRLNFDLPPQELNDFCLNSFEQIAPYQSYIKNVGIGGNSLKIRRNIQRFSHKNT